MFHKPKAGKMNEDVTGEWQAVSPHAVPISLERRADWENELLMQIRADPTLTFMASGDRMMLASITELTEGGDVWVELEDCLVTRRKHLQLKGVKLPADVTNAFLKIKLASTLVDVRNHMKKLETTQVSRLQGWATQMEGWIKELEQLTLEDK